MAGVAFGPNGTPVDIFVAGNACRTQAQGCLATFFCNLGILDELQGVAIVAFFFCMLARQQKPRLRMVKMSQIHKGDFRVLPHVIFMA